MAGGSSAPAPAQLRTPSVQEGGPPQPPQEAGVEFSLPKATRASTVTRPFKKLQTSVYKLKSCNLKCSTDMFYIQSVFPIKKNFFLVEKNICTLKKKTHIKNYFGILALTI